MNRRNFARNVMRRRSVALVNLLGNLESWKNYLADAHQQSALNERLREIKESRIMNARKQIARVNTEIATLKSRLPA